MKDILNSNLLKEIQKYIDPNQVITRKCLKIIIENIDNISLSPKEKKQIIWIINNKIKDSFDKDDNWIISSNLKLMFYIINLRNRCQEKYYQNLISINFDNMSNFIKNFYKNFKNIKNINNDTFIKMEGLINQIKYIKYYKIKKLLLTHSILDFDYHKNYKDVIYIYSCFDKICSLIYFFNLNYNKKKLYFSKHMKRENIKYFRNNKNLLNKSHEFIKSNLFKDFKNIRNNITHNHTMPMDNYLTHLYSFISLFLLLYYIQEILIPHYKK